MGMLLVTEMITVHDAKMKMSERLRDADTLEETETCGNLYNKLARTFATQMDTLQRWCLGPQPNLQYHVSINDGGRAIVGPVNPSVAHKDNADDKNFPPQLADQYGLAMPSIEPDDRPAATVPLIEQDQE